VDERKWLSSRRPRRLLEFIQGKAGARKLRLFACAVGRLLPRLRDPVENDQRESALDVTERFADGPASEDELLLAARCPGGHGVWTFCLPNAAEAASFCAAETQLRAGLKADLLRDIFGNPFRPTSLWPDWLTPAVVDLAQAAYQRRQLPGGLLDPATLAVLSDALEEAGCTQADVLEHLRATGPHVRGCFAVDLCLGRR
jgi:hypothetical protein